jgi:hypothetical protein
MSNINMRTVIALVCQVIFFILFFFISHFVVIRDLKILFIIIIFMAISVLMFDSIRKNKGKLSHTFFLGGMFFLLFEATKYIEYKCGFLPLYVESSSLTPQIISFLFVTFYFGFIYAVFYLTKGKKSFFSKPHQNNRPPKGC